MIAYKKHRRKVDPVKQILARLDEKQSKSGLSLYSRTDLHEPAKDGVLPVVQPVSGTTTGSAKGSKFFPDLSAARQKAQRRLNAGLKQSIHESNQKSVLFAEAKADRRLNLTFPPAGSSHQMAATVNHDRQSYAFGGWSDSPSAGVENLRNSHGTSMNPFGYSRRTLAFQPTSLNYVVEWPETWPLKIMSIGRGTGRLHKKKTKPKPQHIRKVHFENSPAPRSSPEGEKNYYSKISAAAGMATPSQNQSIQVLPDRQTPVTSLSTDMTIPQSADIKNIKQEKQDEWVPQRDEGVLDNVTADNSLEAGDINSTEYARVYSDTSSLSESVYVREDNSKKTEIPDETETQQADNTRKSSSVPPCTPTPEGVENAPNCGESEGQDLQQPEEDGGDDDSKRVLMEIVSQIAAEPEADYMQDI